MVNNIKGQNQSSLLNNIKQQNADTQKQVNSDAAKPSVKSAVDSVSLTPQAQQLKSLQEKSQHEPAYDSKKVAELKKAISEGSYRVDAQKLAQNIANFEFDVYG
jgi:negative regulator of flagellin synthesis FlgM